MHYEIDETDAGPGGATEVPAGQASYLMLPKRKRLLQTEYKSSYPTKIMKMIERGEETLPMHVAYALTCEQDQLAVWASSHPEFAQAMDAAIGASRIRLWNDLRTGNGNPKSIQFALKHLGILEKDVERMLNIREAESLVRTKMLDQDGRTIEILFEEVADESAQNPPA